jgi:hypothetical protein
MFTKSKQTLTAIIAFSLSISLFGCAQDNPVAATKLHADNESFAFTVTIKNTSTSTVLPGALAPLAWAVYPAGGSLFTTGSLATGGLEALAEDGDPEGLIEGLTTALSKGHLTDPLAPGETASFSFNASPGSVLSFASMVVETNDVFVGPEKNHVDLFDGRNEPLSGSLAVALFDAGTEVNQAPGKGDAQAPRQSAPNTGTEEVNPISLLSERQDGFNYPTAAQYLEVTLESTHDEAGHDDHDDADHDHDDDHDHG